jgi:hypothetical protein
MMADRSKAVYDYCERSLAEDHARVVDATNQPTDRPASSEGETSSNTPNSSTRRPAWAARRRGI